MSASATARSDEPVPVLRLEGITKSFGDTWALRGVDLSIGAGETLCIIGPSGCGKSTLVRCINFLEQPNEGYIYINGEPMGLRNIGGRRRRDSEANINRMRSRIGTVFQQLNVWPHLTALQNVAKPQVWVLGRAPADAEATARRLLARIGLANKTESYPSQLSGGELQRVAIARALAMEPQLMLFDEPTSALDPECVAEVLAVMRELAEAKRTMLIVTHELGFAAEIADRVIFLDEGMVVEEGLADAILNNPKSERLRQFMAKVLHREKPAA